MCVSSQVKINTVTYKSLWIEICCHTLNIEHKVRWIAVIYETDTRSLASDGLIYWRDVGLLRRARRLYEPTMMLSLRSDALGCLAFFASSSSAFKSSTSPGSISPIDSTSDSLDDGDVDGDDWMFAVNETSSSSSLSRSSGFGVALALSRDGEATADATD